jgi:UDP-N-acetyl-D-mannosaminuronic acid dehydrogenase
MPAEITDNRKRTVAVVGLGKIGLPLAAQFASKGLQVIGCDVLPEVVDAVNAGRSHVLEEPGLSEAVQKAVGKKLLRATTDTAAAVRESATVVLIVPLLTDREHRIDFRNLESAARAVGAGLRSDTLVICETTVPVGTTRDRLAPIIEQASGQRLGSGLFMAFSPERLYAGRIFADLRKYPKIVGGLDAASTQRAVDFYKEVLDAEVWPVENAETAEFAKLAETTYRDVNIALANELAIYGAARDVNVMQAFQAANSQPFSHLHRPSIGVGGHCIPVYPHFLLADATEGELALPRMSRSINDHMVDVAIEALEGALGSLEGRRVLVLGASYREDVKELAFSTAIPLVERLHERGADVLLHDPLFRAEELSSLPARVVDIRSNAHVEADAIVVQAYHAAFRTLDWSRFRGVKVVFDGRRSLEPETARGIGAAYLAVDLPADSPK